MHLKPRPSEMSQVTLPANDEYELYDSSIDTSRFQIGMPWLPNSASPGSKAWCRKEYGLVEHRSVGIMPLSVQLALP